MDNRRGFFKKMFVAAIAPSALVKGSEAKEIAAPVAVRPEIRYLPVNQHKVIEVTVVAGVYPFVSGDHTEWTP